MTETRDSVFLGDSSKLEQVDLEMPLADARSDDCQYYTSAYTRAARRCDDLGEQESAFAYRFLSVLTSFHPCYHDREQPYKPLAIWDGNRSLVPGDLCESDIEIVASIFSRITDAALMARVGDILWLTIKDHEAARIAAEKYLESGRSLIENSDGWSMAIKQFTRAFQLSTYLGQENEPWKTIQHDVEAIALSVQPDEQTYRACQLMDVLLAAKAGDHMKFLGKAIAHAEAAVDEFSMARAYWEIEAKWQHIAGDGDAEQHAHLMVAETWVSEAESRVDGDDPSYLAGCWFLSRGVEALRRAKADSTRIAEMKARLIQWQKEIRSEMSTFSFELDVTDAVQSARDFVDSDDFEESVQRLALFHPLIDKGKLRDDVLIDPPLADLFGTTCIDSESTASRGPLISSCK